MNNISANCISLIQCILLGDYGLLTMTPRYLFCVLFPVMLLLEISGQILPRIPFLRETSPGINQLFYSLIGFGCTTAALASLDSLSCRSARNRMAAILVLLVPCSAKLTITAAFASMVTLRVFGTYLLFQIFFAAAVYFAISRFFPLTDALTRPNCNTASFSISSAIYSALTAVLKTVPTFVSGSILISTAVFLGLFDRFSALLGPFLACVLHLPPEAANLLLLGILKRDFAAAALLSPAVTENFDAVQLTVTVLMMTFSVPCFNAAVLLIKQQRLPGAAAIWLGSLLFSLCTGKIASAILSVCLL